MKKRLVTLIILLLSVIGLFSGCLFGEESTEELTLEVGQEYSIFEEDYTYYSTNSEIATVSDDGIIVAIEQGQCVVVAQNNNKKKKINITVIEKSVSQSTYYTLYTDGGVIEDESWVYYGNDKYCVLEEVALFPTPTKEGYIFTGWYNGEELANVYNGGEAIAKWKIVEYFVTYELNGGNNNELNPLKYDYFQTEDLTLYDATYSGKMFVGWFLDKDYKTQVTKIVPNKHNITLYARFSDYFTVDYKYNSPNQDGIVTVPVGQKLQQPSVYCEEGYFIEWFSDEECLRSYNFNTIVECDFTIYGKLYTELSESFFAFENYTPTNKITSLDEFSAYLDYVNFYEIDENKFIEVDFEEYDEAEANGEFEKILSKSTMPLFSISYSRKTVSNKKMIAVKVTKKQPELKTYSVDTRPKQISAIEFGELEAFSSTRTDDFDDFKYKNLAKEVSVTNTNQLFFALEHRVKPVPTKGSSAETALNKCKDILRKICDDTCSDLQKAKAIYTYLIKNVEYVLPIVESGDVYEALSYDAYYMEGVLNNGAGVCDGISKTFSCLMNLEGIRCVRATSSDHAWNEAFIDGKWYTFDATHGNVSTSENLELLAYNNFMINEEIKENFGYVDGLRTEIVADGVYDFYANDTFIYNGNTYDRNVNSIAELTALFAYSYSKAKEYNYSTFTVNLVLDYSYGAEFSDDIKEARDSAGLRSVSVSYYELKNTQKTNLIVMFK